MLIFLEILILFLSPHKIFFQSNHTYKFAKSNNRRAGNSNLEFTVELIENEINLRNCSNLQYLLILIVSVFVTHKLF